MSRFMGSHNETIYSSEATVEIPRCGSCYAVHRNMNILFYLGFAPLILYFIGQGIGVGFEWIPVSMHAPLCYATPIFSYFLRRIIPKLKKTAEVLTSPTITSIALSGV